MPSASPGALGSLLLIFTTPSHPSFFSLLQIPRGLLTRSTEAQSFTETIYRGTGKKGKASRCSGRRALW